MISMYYRNEITLYSYLPITNGIKATVHHQHHHVVIASLPRHAVVFVIVVQWASKKPKKKMINVDSKISGVTTNRRKKGVQISAAISQSDVRKSRPCVPDRFGLRDVGQAWALTRHCQPKATATAVVDDDDSDGNDDGKLWVRIACIITTPTHCLSVPSRGTYRVILASSNYHNNIRYCYSIDSINTNQCSLIKIVMYKRINTFNIIIFTVLFSNTMPNKRNTSHSHKYVGRLNITIMKCNWVCIRLSIARS